MLRRRDGLIDITIRTMKLLRRNQQLQHRLMALQAETRAFVRSVLSNPENRGLQLARSAAAVTVTVAATPVSPAAMLSASAILSPALTGSSVTPPALMAASPPTAFSARAILASSYVPSPPSSPAMSLSQSSSPITSPLSSPASSPSHPSSLSSSPAASPVYAPYSW